MRIAIPAETDPNETRVAVTPCVRSSSTDTCSPPSTRPTVALATLTDPTFTAHKRHVLDLLHGVHHDA